MKTTFISLVILSVAAFLLSFTILSFTKGSKSIPEAIHSVTHPDATCYGYKTCAACKNCKYCKHCAVDKGSCGVCE